MQINDKDNWRRTKPDDWSVYNWEYLRLLNSISYNIKRIADTLDDSDVSSASEDIALAVRYATAAIEAEANRFDANTQPYTGETTGHYTGHYGG